MVHCGPQSDAYFPVAVALSPVFGMVVPPVLVGGVPTLRPWPRSVHWWPATGPAHHKMR